MSRSDGLPEQINQLLRLRRLFQHLYVRVFLFDIRPPGDRIEGPIK